MDTGETAPPVLTGLRVGAYVVQGPLGTGGMGVVYRALDTKLNRHVAIKFLPDHLAGAAAHSRFQREARLASSLNHPHIVTVHDAGELDGRQYLVTEFVDGGTLRAWNGGQHGWQETIELLVGVADGLAAAHEAGVLHRDVKPENILITRSGYAKLADFGLAKLYEEATSVTATSAQAVTQTQLGIIAGTVAYMSPEQASGRQLDARTDIFSFGVVLYEALAGRRPFTGASTPDLLYAIVHQAVPPLPEHMPPVVRGLVEKALQKDPAGRFQTMRDMVAELRRVVRQGAETAQTTVGNGPFGAQRRWRVAWVAALAVALAVVGTLLGSRLRQRGEPVDRQYTQLTNFADSVVSPALSPDGRMLTFIRGEDTLTGLGQIYVKLLPDGDAVQLTNDTYAKMSPKFTPDGTRIVYSTAIGSATANDPEPTMDTWVVPALGGAPTRLLRNAEGPTWFVDEAGRPRLLFSKMTGRDVQMSIVTSTESRVDERSVYEPPVSGMAHRSYLSPDRKSVLVIEMDAGNWLPCRLVPFDGSSPGRAVGPAGPCTDAAWTPDGKWMYFSTNTGNGVHTWRQRFPDGATEQVTFGVTQEEGIHFAPDGRSFVTSIGTSQSTVWIHDARGDRQITSEGYGFQPSISPDGKRVYYLVRGGSTASFSDGSLWSVDLTSGQRQRLLPDFQMRQFAISADGQRVVFVAVEKGEAAIWLASLNDRTAPRRLATMNVWEAYFGAPSEVVFEAESKGAMFMYRIREDGSDLTKIIPAPGLISFAASPDGRWIPAQDSRAWGSLFVFGTEDGARTLICGKCSPPHGPNPTPPHMSWSPDGRFLYLKFNASLFAIPLQPARTLPDIPGSGFQSEEAVAAIPGAQLISKDNNAYPGPNPSVYAFTKVTTQRNIYRVPVS